MRDKVHVLLNSISERQSRSETRVREPHWLSCGSESRILGQSGSGSRDLMTKNCIILQVKKIYIFIAIHLSLGLLERLPS
jgi:hypothetical protein